METIKSQLVSLYESILRPHERIVLLALDGNGTLMEWNQGAERFIKPSATGIPLTDLLAFSSHPLALDLLRQANQGASVSGTLHFSPDAFAMPISYYCRIHQVEADRYLLFGDPVPPLDERSAVEYARLTNDLARTTRELQKIRSQLEKRNAELEEALAHIQTLHGLLPICAHCKKVRDEDGYWTQVEEYVANHSEATFTHGMCPDCVRRLYPDTNQYLEEKKKVAEMIKREITKPADGASSD